MKYLDLNCNIRATSDCESYGLKITQQENMFTYIIT